MQIKLLISKFISCSYCIANTHAHILMHCLFMYIGTHSIYVLNILACDL